MKKIVIPIVILSASLVACGGVDTEEIEGLNNDLLSAVDELAEVEELEEETASGELFSSKDGRFKIKFQGTPVESSDIIPTEVGNIEMVSYLYEKSVTEAYMVAYSDYPSQLVESSSVEEMLIGARDGSSGNLGITSFDLDEEIEIEGNLGRYFKGSANSIYAEYKLCLVGNRLYQIAILRDGSYSKPENADEFFNSFALMSDEE